MKFIMFLINTPKASLPGLVVALAQIIKYSSGGYLSCDKATLDQIVDSLSVIFGFIALYFAAKGQWPSDPGGPSASGPSAGNPVAKVGMIFLLAITLLSLSACASTGMTGPSFQDQWNKMTPDQKARVTLNGIQAQLGQQFDSAKAFVAANPQYKDTWQKEIVPMFDKANKAVKTMIGTAMLGTLTPDQVYLQIQPMITELSLKLISMGMKKGEIINGPINWCRNGVVCYESDHRYRIPALAAVPPNVR